MKRVSGILLVLLISVSVTTLSGKAASEITFDDIMDNARSEENESASSILPFDDFCNKYMTLCKAWGASWDTSDVVDMSDTDKESRFDIDGVIITCEADRDGLHPIKEIAVESGSPSTDYNKMVKMLALIASLEHDAPLTTPERKALLSTVSSKLDAALFSLTLLSSSPEDGKETLAMAGDKFNFYWRYADGVYYLVVKL